MNLRNVNVFLALMRTRSATSTALLTGISQPAVSQIIKQLERELGIKLFVLLNGRLAPTPEGEQVAAEMAEISSAYTRMKGFVDSLRNDGQGLLRIGTLTYANVFLPDAMRRFQEVAPNAQVELKVMRAASIVEAIAKGEADVGIVTDAGDPQLCRYKDLRGLDSVAVVPLQSELAKLPYITPEALRGERILSYHPESPFCETASRVFAASGERLHIWLHVASTSLLCALVEQGVGIALLEPFTMLGPQRFDVKIKPFKPRMPMRPRIVYSANRPPSLLVQHFMKMFEGTVRSMIAQHRP